MPTVKWVDGWYDNKDDVPVEVQGALKTIPMPVLTLDDLEAWLKNERDRHSNCQRNCFTFDDLLAQVQAWKGQP